MNNIKQVAVRLPETVLKLAADPMVRSTVKKAVLDVAQAIKSLGAVASAVRAA